MTCKLVIDSNVWGAEAAFSSLGNLTLLSHQDITPDSLKGADILITRSGTQVNQGLLQGSPVRFVGTATIGDDHVDKAYLAQQGITFVSAAGSSTESVVEYMLASFFVLEQQGKLDFSNDTLGIIGVGRIGSLLNQACGKFSFKTLLNDPPRGLTASLSDVLGAADILTLHTPLTHDGGFATHHLIGKQELAQFKGKGIINAGRGACLDNDALLDWLNEDIEHFAVLDCWEHEPNINLNLLNHAQVLIATPHIAGHSLDGKAANTYFVYKDLCDFIQVLPTWDMQAALPEIKPNTLPQGLRKSELALAMYPIENDNQIMKQAGKSSDFASWFSSYRKQYPVRRAWDKSLESSGYAKDIFF